MFNFYLSLLFSHSLDTLRDFFVVGVYFDHWEGWVGFHFFKHTYLQLYICFWDGFYDGQDQVRIGLTDRF